jgi:hypothetical protein
MSTWQSIRSRASSRACAQNAGSRRIE